MGVDFTSQIQLSINVTAERESTFKEVKKFNEDTGEPYLKKELITETNFFIGDSEKSLNQKEFEKLRDKLSLTYNKDYECLEQTICSISKKGYDVITFELLKLEEAKTSLLRNLHENGIFIDEDEVVFDLVHYLS